MLNTTEVIYSTMDVFLSQVKRYDAIILATIEDGMHPPLVHTAMQQLFDGVIEFRLHKIGTKIIPLLRVAKMRGAKPDQNYYRVNFTGQGVELSSEALEPEDASISEVFVLQSGNSGESSSAIFNLGSETQRVFEYLAKSFVQDYESERLSADQSGWRTRGKSLNRPVCPKRCFTGRVESLGRC